MQLYKHIIKKTTGAGDGTSKTRVYQKSHGHFIGT